MKNEPPLIAVTGPAKRFRFGWWATRFALRRLGARCLYITADAPEWPENVDGFIIGGGDDINPKHYGATGAAGAVYDEARDALEMRALEYALDRELPILGICRGSQLLNIVLGGSLIEDLRPLRKRTPNRNSILAMKYANIQADTKLRTIVGDRRIKINTLHHQAVDRLGDGMVASAYDDDNFLQASEHQRRNFVIGVQWHPEYLPFSSQQRELFQSFLNATQKS